MSSTYTSVLGLKVQETNELFNLFSSSPLLVSSLIMTLRYTTKLLDARSISNSSYEYPQNLVIDRMTMRCLTVDSSLHVHVTDVAGCHIE
jgi:hypothetical protein